MRDQLIGQGMGRRTVLRGLGAAGLAAGLPLTSALGQSKPSQITVTSYGGIFETALRDTFVKDFTKRTGVNVQVQLGDPNNWLSQIEATPDHPPLDVVLASVDLAIDAGRKGLIEKISVEKVPNLADIPEQFTTMCEGWASCFNYGACGLMYDLNRVKNPPKSMVEFVDRTERGDWTASLPTMAWQPTVHNLIWNLNDIYGGTLADISPALKAIKRMKKNTVWWGSVTDFLNHLSTGEGDIGLYNDGRAWAAFDSGMKVGFVNPSEGGVMYPTAVLKAKNAPQIAWEYVNLMLAPEPNGAFSAVLNYAGTNRKIVYSEKTKSRFTPWDKTRLPPMAEMAKYLPAWAEAWNKEIGV